MNAESLSAYERVQKARETKRAGIYDYIEALFDDFMEFHGDRLYRDDPSIVGGIGVLDGMPVTVIGHRKGKDTGEQIKYNFGMTSPEGYRKAIRLMEQAERFNRPVLTLVDTPGAYPGIEAESNGQSNAISGCIAKMCNLKTPSICIITGEGNSGGALALAVADRVWMLENAVYSILSPEGFASILWKDASKSVLAAGLMRLTADDLKNDGFIDTVIKEDDKLTEHIRKLLISEFHDLGNIRTEELLKKRYARYRKVM